MIFVVNNFFKKIVWILKLCRSSKAKGRGRTSKYNFALDSKFCKYMFLMSQHLFMVILVSFIKHVVVGRTRFYWTSNKLEHHFLNVERIRTCSSIGDQTRTNEPLTYTSVGMYYYLPGEEKHLKYAKHIWNFYDKTSQTQTLKAHRRRHHSRVEKRKAASWQPLFFHMILLPSFKRWYGFLLLSSTHPRFSEFHNSSSRRRDNNGKSLFFIVVFLACVVDVVFSIEWLPL